MNLTRTVLLSPHRHIAFLTVSLGMSSVCTDCSHLDEVCAKCYKTMLVRKKVDNDDDDDAVQTALMCIYKLLSAGGRGM